MEDQKILHPIFFALYPILFLYAFNIDQVFARDTVGPIFLVLLFSGILFFIFKTIFRDKISAGLSTTLFLVLFFSYGHVYALGDFWTQHRYLLGAWVLLFVFGFTAFYKWRGKLDVINRTLNIVGGLLVLFLFGQIAIFNTGESFLKSENKNELPSFVTEAKTKELPDIYFIVPDAYESNWGLKEIYQFDNSEFVADLEKRGFITVPNSISNYNATSMTLPALLNMDYMENIVPTGVLSKETVDSRALIEQSVVPKILKALGYTHVHVGSRWGLTYTNKEADENINQGFLSEFNSILLESTPIYPFSFKVDFYDKRKEQWDRIQYQFDELEKIPEREELTFTFVHLGIPHAPFVFEEDGSFLAREQEPQEETLGFNTEDYISQLIYLNNRLLAAIDVIFEKSEHLPIVIIQSDHGSRIFKRDVLSPEGLEEMDRLSALYVRDRNRNFAAYFLPGVDKGVVYNTLTPVNTFRVLFNSYFNGKYELLDDRSYFAPPWDKYELTDVTEDVVF